MPIALITANIQDEVIARARAVNATFVGKPLDGRGPPGLRVRRRAAPARGSSLMARS